MATVRKEVAASPGRWNKDGGAKLILHYWCKKILVISWRFWRVVLDGMSKKKGSTAKTAAAEKADKSDSKEFT